MLYTDLSMLKEDPCDVSIKSSLSSQQEIIYNSAVVLLYVSAVVDFKVGYESCTMVQDFELLSQPTQSWTWTLEVTFRIHILNGHNVNHRVLFSYALYITQSCRLYGVTRLATFHHRYKLPSCLPNFSSFFNSPIYKRLNWLNWAISTISSQPTKNGHHSTLHPISPTYTHTPLTPPAPHPLPLQRRANLLWLSNPAPPTQQTFPKSNKPASSPATSLARTSSPTTSLMCVSSSRPSPHLM